MVSDLKGLTGRSGCTSQGLGGFVRSPESGIRTVRRRHLASQSLTPAGGCLASSFESVGSPNPGEVKMCVMNHWSWLQWDQEGEAEALLIPKTHQELRYTCSKLELLPVHPEKFGAPQN